jgi:general L-amino acid transport system permease protein
MTSSEHPQPVQMQIASSRPPFWRDERVLRIAAQVLSAILIIGFLIWMVNNVIESAAQRGLNLGFQFLSGEAGFPIGETDLPYTPASSFAYAFLVGVVNTLKVSVIGILLATVLGTIVGVARLSTNWLVSRIALIFIEIHRNIPLLVLLFLWYSGVFIQLPRVKDSFVWPGPTFVNQRGVYFTWPLWNENSTLFAILTGLGVVLAVIAWIWLRRIRETTGRSTYFGAISLLILIAFPVVALALTGGRPFDLEIPSLQGFNFQGGLHFSPEFSALLIGLVTYTAAFIAEVVRAGIQAVSRGQLEAASALGLKSFQVLGLVIMPQALRIIIPPLISQYLNLTKNSSLAIFIGYPELFFIGKTTINQAGRAAQVFVLVMLVYLAMSLVTSVILNLYNNRIQLVER